VVVSLILVIDDYDAMRSMVRRVLESAGYAVFAFEEQLSGPRIVAATSARRLKRPYDIPPSYLATRDPDRARHLLSRKGWQSLQGR